MKTLQMMTHTFYANRNPKTYCFTFRRATTGTEIQHPAGGRAPNQNVPLGNDNYCGMGNLPKVSDFTFELFTSIHLATLRMCS